MTPENLRREWAPLVMVALLAMSMLGSPPMAQAQGSIEPRAIAIAPTDLPPGFSPSSQGIGRPGPTIPFATTHSVSLEREKTEDGLQLGPVAVTQVLFRIDRLVVPKDFFAEVADQVVREQSFDVLPNPDSSGESIRVQKREIRGDTEITLFGIGMVKDNFIWFTFVGGTAPATTLDTALAINNITTTKYDQLKALPEQPALSLLDRILQTPLKSEELPVGLLADAPQTGPLSDRSKEFKAQGQADVRIRGYEEQAEISFIVYPSEDHARDAFAQAPVKALERGASIVTPPNLPVAVVCAAGVATPEGQSVGVTSCIVQIGAVEVTAFSAIPGAPTGNLEHALILTRVGYEHVGRLK